MKKFLTIAGSDCCGGAGIQADIRVAAQHGLFPMSVVTALTAQTRGGVRDVLLTPPAFVAAQLDAVFCDGAPDAIKIGMLGNKGIVEAVTQKLIEHKAKNIVLDTVIMSSSGYELLDKEGVASLKAKLLPLCYAVTPNIPEAETLADMKINNKTDMEKCAKKLSSICPNNIIVTGGHLEGACDDLLLADGRITWFCGERIQSDNTHGTGCFFSSCLACNLALGHSMEEGVKNAKEYVAERIMGFVI